jgi:uncharacterized membrane protein YkvA (DUF1232 family)
MQKSAALRSVRPGLLPAFFRPRAVVRFMRDKRASFASKLLLLLAIAYVILPVDLVPDVPFIGWLDDLGFVSIALGWIGHKISKHERETTSDAGGEE